MIQPKQHDSLPKAQTAFIGREAECLLIQRMLTQNAVRLLTLIGPPGVGKTRLAIEAARDIAAAFVGGVWFVDLSSLADAVLVLSTIAQTLGADVVDPAYQLTAFHAAIKQPTVLILDNFEQLLPAAADLQALLEAIPCMTFLVTSRAPLQLQGEQIVTVQPLLLPSQELLPLPQLATLPSVRLFVQRAQMRQANFALTDSNAASVTALCVALDGLPLALELAAAQMNRIPLPALVAWVQQHQALPPWSAADLPARQHTMQVAIQWSYDLLESAAQVLFQRLAVLVNEWTVDAACAIAAPDDDTDTVLATLATLADASLIAPAINATDAPRFRMLHVIRTFALARLAESGEHTSVEQRHTAYFLSLAEQAHDIALNQQQLVALPLLKRLAAEQDDVHAVLQRSLDQVDATETMLRFAVALAPVWMLHGRLHQGRVWLARVVEQATVRSDNHTLRAVLPWAATFAYHQGDLYMAEQYHEQALTASEQADDQRAQAAALLGLALIADARGAYDRAIALNEQALEIYDALADKNGRAWALSDMGHVLLEEGKQAQAAALLYESLRIFEQLHDPRGQAWTRIGLGHWSFERGDTEQAAHQYALSGNLFAQLGDVRGAAWARTNTGRTLHANSDLDNALKLHQQSVADYRRVGDKRGVARTLLHTAHVLIDCANHTNANAALVECQRIFHEIGDMPNEKRAQTLRHTLIKAALPSPPNTPLTSREHDVLALLAEGLTNKAIAAHLSIQPRTVSLHLESIYRKLGVSSRVAAVRTAQRAGLLQETDKI